MPPRKRNNDAKKEAYAKQNSQALKNNNSIKLTEELLMEQELENRYKAVQEPVHFLSNGNVIKDVPFAVIRILEALKKREEIDVDAVDDLDEESDVYITIWDLCMQYYGSGKLAVEYVRALVVFVLKMIDYGMVGATDDSFPMVYSNEMSRVILEAYELGRKDDIPF